MQLSSGICQRPHGKEARANIYGSSPKMHAHKCSKSFRTAVRHPQNLLAPRWCVAVAAGPPDGRPNLPPSPPWSAPPAPPLPGSVPGTSGNSGTSGSQGVMSSTSLAMAALCVVAVLLSCGCCWCCLRWQRRKRRAARRKRKREAKRARARRRQRQRREDNRSTGSDRHSGSSSGGNEGSDSSDSSEISESRSARDGERISRCDRPTGRRARLGHKAAAVPAGAWHGAIMHSTTGMPQKPSTCAVLLQQDRASLHDGVGSGRCVSQLLESKLSAGPLQVAGHPPIAVHLTHICLLTFLSSPACTGTCPSGPVESAKPSACTPRTIGKTARMVACKILSCRCQRIKLGSVAVRLVVAVCPPGRMAPA
jgi:hypothetical protein